MLLRKMRYYRYQGDLTMDKLVEFAQEHYHTATHQDKVPLLASFWEEIMHFWNEDIKVRGSILASILMQNDRGEVYISAIFMVYLMPLITLYIFYAIMKNTFCADEGAVERTKILQIKNAHEKRKIEKVITQHPSFQRRQKKFD